MLAAVGSLNSDDRTLANSGYAQKRVFNLANLDSEAADLHLKIPAAEIIQLAVGQPAAEIAAAVQQAARAVWICQERSLRALWVVDVAAPHADAGEDDLSRRAERNGGEVLVHDVDRHVVNRTAERDSSPFGRAVHDFVVGVVGRLGQSVRIHQLDPRLDGEPALHQLS